MIDRDKFGVGRGPSVIDKPGILLAMTLAIMRRWTSIGVAIGAVLLLWVTALNTVHGLPLGATAAAANSEVSILAYHRFGATVNDAMTVRTVTFRWQLDYLKEHHHPVVPLQALISYLQGHSGAPPPGAVVITVDDGHQSVFKEMRPLVREYNVPVTLFIYPSAISNAAYAMTWDELGTLRRSGLFDVQSHSYWHPNFRTEKRRLSPAQYQAFAAMQLVKARTVLESRLEIKPELIAWPFGIVDAEPIGIARASGYVAGFTLERRFVTGREDIMALPRFLVTDSSRQNFASMLPQESR